MEWFGNVPPGESSQHECSCLPDRGGVKPLVRERYELWPALSRGACPGRHAVFINSFTRVWTLWLLAARSSGGVEVLHE